MTAFGYQVVALLDHLEVAEAVVGGTSLGANVTLEVACMAPERLRGMILEMPVLDNALEAGIVTFGPLLFWGRCVPRAVSALRGVTRRVPRGVVPFWAGIWLDTLNQEPAPMAALVHGIFFGRVAPSSRLRKQIEVPAVVIGHRATRCIRPLTRPCSATNCPTAASSRRSRSSSGADGPSASRRRCWSSSTASGAATPRRRDGTLPYQLGRRRRGPRRAIIPIS